MNSFFTLQFDGSDVSVLVAYLAGFATFFASCLLPLVPTYLAYITGVSINDPEAAHNHKRTFVLALLFVLGFTTSFVLLGLSLNKLAAEIAPIRALVEKLSGILFIFLGLFLLGVFKRSPLYSELRFDVHAHFRRFASIHALLMGVAFGFGWSPCIGPVLAVILFWSAQAETALSGILLLTAFGIGLGTPFILIALGWSKLLPIVKQFDHLTVWLNRFSAVFIILSGIMLLFGQFGVIGKVILELIQLNPNSF